MIKDLPKAKPLLEGKVVLTPAHIAKNRHLAAAGLYDTVELRLSVVHQQHEVEEPEDFDDLVELRSSKGFGLAGGKVACPGCEEVDDDELCDWCGGSGLVSVPVWDAWFMQERGCRLFAKGCETFCKLTSCPHDELRCLLDVPVLVLEARKLGGAWAERGNSVSGFKLKGIAANQPALMRYLSLVAVSLGFGLIDD